MTKNRPLTFGIIIALATLFLHASHKNTNAVLTVSFISVFLISVFLLLITKKDIFIYSLIASLLSLLLLASLFIYDIPINKADKYTNLDVSINGYISNVKSDKYSSFVIHTYSINDEPIRINIKSFYYGNTELSNGDGVQINGELNKSFYNSLSFDSKEYNKSKGISYAVEIHDLNRNEQYSSKPLKHIEKVKSELQNPCNSLENAGFIKAISFGDKSDLSPDTNDIFTKSGLSHMLCVSGLHLSLIIFSFYSFLTKLGLKKQLRIVISMILTICYMALTGFSPSVLRAGIMTIIYLSSFLSRRKNDSITSLFTALYLIILANPYSIYDTGLRLSFLSTLGIISVGVPICVEFEKSEFFRKFEEKNIITKEISKTGSYVFTSFMCTLSAIIFSFPEVISSYNKIYLISFVANILVVFIFNYVLVFAFIFIIFSSTLNVFSVNVIFPVFGTITDFLCNIIMKLVYALSKFDTLSFKADVDGKSLIAVLSFITITVCFMIFDSSRSLSISLIICSLIIAVTYYPLSQAKKNIPVISIANTSKQMSIITEYKDETNLFITSADSKIRTSKLIELSEYRGIEHFDNIYCIDIGSFNSKEISKLTNSFSIGNIYCHIDDLSVKVLTDIKKFSKNNTKINMIIKNGSLNDIADFKRKYGHCEVTIHNGNNEFIIISADDTYNRKNLGNDCCYDSEIRINGKEYSNGFLTFALNDSHKILLIE